jgi:hypothetical protein
MNYEYEIVRDGLTRSVKVKSHTYDLIEFTIKQVLVDDKGKEITNTGYTTFYDSKEFFTFFGPFINDMKRELDNANSVKNG